MHIIALYILLGIIALITLLLCLRAHLCIVYEDDLRVYIRVLFIKYFLIPEKKKKFKESKKKKKQEEKKIVLKKRSADEKKPSLLDKLSLIKEILAVFLKAFSKHLHVKIVKMHIKVGSPDASQTAILYGAISGAVAGIIEIIDSYTNLNKIKDSTIIVEPDFLSEKCEAKINISFSMSVFGALVILAKTFWKYTILKNSK